MDFTTKDIEECMQVSKPRARAIVKVCKLYDNAKRSHLKFEYARKLDQLCDTFGIEGISEVSLQYPDSDEIEFDYLNVGDTYQTTIIFIDGKTTLGSWGDMLEEKERELYEDLNHPRACICEECNHHCFYANQDASHRLQAIHGGLECPNCGGKLHYSMRYKA
jgi:hypothetical protein